LAKLASARGAFIYTRCRLFLDLNRRCINTNNYEPYSVKVQTTSLPVSAH
jgi:hypothetical protein